MGLRSRSLRIAVISSILCGFTCSWAGAGGLRIFRKKCEVSCLEQAAIEIDRLEQQLHQSGTVSIKAPDIWGESRLTKHRQEFEKVLADKVDEFQLRLNANIRRSDQTYLANALAIQAALDTRLRNRSGNNDPGDLIPIPAANDTNNTAFVNSLTLGTIANPQPNGTSATPVDRNAVFQLANGQPATSFTGFEGAATGIGIGLEPTIELDQLKRYLDHLHEIRRVNEGDDTSDSPGYSLNLVRVPVSIIPGDITREGHGAEVAITCKPHITPELLPRVYRELVINDLVDMLGTSMLHVAEHVDGLVYVGDPVCGRPSGKITESWRNASEKTRLIVVVKGGKEFEESFGSTAVPETGLVRLAGSELILPPPPFGQIISNLESYKQNVATERSVGRAAAAYMDSVLPQAAISTPNAQVSDAQTPPQVSQYSPDDLIYLASPASKIPDIAPRSQTGVTVGIARNARNPIAASQAQVVSGTRPLLVMGYEFWKTASDLPHSRHLSDARGFLREELQSGYDYLLTPQGLHLWELIPQIHELIRSNNEQELENLRIQSVQTYRVLEGGTWNEVPGVPSAVSSAAWWILVESALLNQKLNDDIQRVSQDPLCTCQCFGPQAFYGPDPAPEARQAFIEYVNCRWPIHVFALDPVVQQQNIADQFSMRREMQLALALNFAAGRMNAQSMTRYARRLELDMETIALNKTDVAFGHGSDTFGWRFTPRVQTPPFESNLTVIGRDMIWGGPNKDHLRKRWELEPGLRECVAIVLMPSFIEHVTFHSRGNYFALTDCCRHLDTKGDLRSSVAQNVRWSEQMQSLDCLLKQIHCESERFLPGEVDRVNERVMQLAKSLPLQTVHARVPNENTLGGFEMFSSGVTDLGPELLDYYGEPAIDPGRETTMFLVGKHFSVHETQVIAGHKKCEFSLLSREVLQVKIPAGVRVEERFRPDTNCPERFLDVHLATPYGVTSHLEIPVVEALLTSAPVFAWETREIPLTLRYIYSSAGIPSKGNFDIPPTNVFTSAPQEIVINVPPYAALRSDEFDLDLQVYFDANRTGVLVKSYDGTAPFADLPFNTQRQKIVVSGGAYSTFINDLVTEIDKQLEKIPVDKVPPMLDLRVSARIKNKDAIAGELHILVNLERELP